MEAFSARYASAVRACFDEMCGEICVVLGHERSGDWEKYVWREYGGEAAGMIQHCRTQIAAIGEE